MSVAGRTEKLWQQVYEEESGVLFGYLSRQMDHELAADITHDAFIKLYRTMAKGRSIENYRAYLFQISRNLIADRHRSRSEEINRPAAYDSSEIIAGISSEDESPDRALLANEMREIINTAVAGMNESEQRVFDLKWNYGIKQKDMAEILGKSSRQIRRDLEKVARKLKAAFTAAGWNDAEGLR